MKRTDSPVFLLKIILDNLDVPEKLDTHPWIKSCMVEEACTKDPNLALRSPGRQLVVTISQLFRRMLPIMPPRQGIRLDNRWGEFGLLAAQYFAPFLFGLPYPTSLREAWQGIDRAILLFVFDRETDITDEQRIRYRLVGNESEIAPNSTISDWHRKGIGRLADLIVQYEKHLKSSKSGDASPNILVQSGKVKTLAKKMKKVWPWLGRLLLLTVLVFLVLGVYRGWQVFQRVRSIQENADALFTLSVSFSKPEQIEQAQQPVSVLRNEMGALQDDLTPFMKIVPLLGWVPVYGGDLSQLPHLLEMGVQLSIVGDEVINAIAPALSGVNNNESLNILDLISGLKDADSQLLAAQVALSRARAARQQIDTEKLSMGMKTLITKKIDPLLLSMEGSFPVDDVLSMARLAPRLLGAVGNGSQTYMIVIQNEDELRPTGGFLTAVGLLVVQDGKIQSLSFESSELVDDLSKPYPKAPWQLDEYMMSEILLFRDSNWFTNFPTTLEWAKFLYGYSRAQSVDGVIAIDQHVIEELLRAIGPIQVEGVDYPITAENVLLYMRSAKEKAPPGVKARTWDRKQFINQLAAPILEKILSSNGDSWKNLYTTIIQLLEEKHVLLQFNDPEMTALLMRRGWAGVVQPPANSDFLMAVDSNIGFNKTNAQVQTTLTYSLDITNYTKPIGRLTVTHFNNGQGNIECIQNPAPVEGEVSGEAYPINDCYWAYMRIYTPAGTELITSTPQEIPAGWSLREKEIPAHTDILDEGIAGVQGFGTILVVPIGQSLDTSFTFSLPAAVVQTDQQNGSHTYRLTIQKQPGTIAIPFTLRIRLPIGAQVESASVSLRQEGDELVLSTNLRTDVVFEINFK